ncbi:MAG: hypothetical protein J6T22_03100, partial [Bacteroidales bacterium]|nr:hypothetical protein [Bacteroidales bacterium]
LVCTSLPGVVRACEVELSFESLRDLLVAGEFLTVISSYQMYLNLVEALRFNRRAGFSLYVSGSAPDAYSCRLSL